MKTRQTEVTIDGRPATQDDLNKAWRLALEPINAINEAPGNCVADVVPFVWGILAAGGWTLRASSRCEYSVADYVSPSTSLRCDITPTLGPSESLLIEVGGDVNGSDLPAISCRVEL